MSYTIKNTNILKGSPVISRRTCGNKGCKCYRGELHESLYLSRTINGKSTMTYIPKDKEKYVLECVKRYKDLLKKIDEFSDRTLRKIKRKK